MIRTIAVVTICKGHRDWDRTDNSDARDVDVWRLSIGYRKEARAKTVSIIREKDTGFQIAYKVAPNCFNVVFSLFLALTAYRM